MVESAIVTFHENNHVYLIDYNIGTFGTVEFNFDKVWDFFTKNGRVLNKGYLLFTHVHPFGLAQYSHTDKNCMEGFSMALGIPFYFDIIFFYNDNIFDLKHVHNRWLVKKTEILHEDADIELSNSYILLLKLMSYGTFKS